MEWEDFDDESEEEEEEEQQEVWEMEGDLPELITEPWIMRGGKQHYEMPG